jgi:hypothetical protein
MHCAPRLSRLNPVTPQNAIASSRFLPRAPHVAPQSSSHPAVEFTQLCRPLSATVVTSRDATFSALRLWQDTNHNGVSEPGELHTLPELDLRTIDLDFTESKRTDRYGNRFRYRAKVSDANGNQLGRWAWDVFLIPSR